MYNLTLGNNTYNNINAIIFDLGGVIVDIDYHTTINTFKSAGFENFDSMYTQFKQNELFDKFEKGLINPNEFRLSIQNDANVFLSEPVFNNAWNSMIGEVPTENIILLKQLKIRLKTYLLSNTNEIHLDYFFNYMLNKHHIKDFNQLFHKAYYSSRMHMRKPDTETYHQVITENGLIASQTLFIDDTPGNVKGAKKAGLQAYYLRPAEKITNLLSGLY